ncbi:hypothetical protein NP493_1626g00000 [Ridgeia piscesae]|uniref:Uncharacterized protein n=1 Tax=Ridgeia piscesae TaxID=27915 RepID=A0AAD9JXA6_RIDPI|nr:hypothetical protein NP493_1626g00000 [Ridgeia piscesae]
MYCQQKCAQVGHIQRFYLVDPWQAWSKGSRVIPVYTSHKMELPCSQRRTRYGITLSTC